MDKSVRTKVLNVGDFTRTFFHYGVKIDLCPKESVVVTGDVSDDLKSHPSFDVSRVSEDEKPQRKKKRSEVA